LFILTAVVAVVCSLATLSRASTILFAFLIIEFVAALVIVPGFVIGYSRYQVSRARPVKKPGTGR
jgi:hypothetical protein